MTTIVAIQGDGWATIAADSRVVGSRVFSTNNPSKIVEAGEYIIGAAGDLRGGNLIANAFKPPAVPAKCNLDQFITTTFIPALRYCFDQHGFQSIKDSVASQETEIIVLIRGVVYEIDEDYSWLRDDSKIHGVGSGAPYALGALAALNAGTADDPQLAETLCKTAVEIAARFDDGTAKPVVIKTQFADRKKNRR